MWTYKIIIIIKIKIDNIENREEEIETNMESD
jgi:hypothetical protein